MNDCGALTAVWGWTCPSCNRRHKRTCPARFTDGRIQLKCRYCHQVETVEEGSA